MSGGTRVLANRAEIYIHPAPFGHRIARGEICLMDDVVFERNERLEEEEEEEKEAEEGLARFSRARHANDPPLLISLVANGSRF